MGEQSTAMLVCDTVINPIIYSFFSFFSFLSFCSFSVDISSPSDRLSVTLTLLLTAVAFKFVVSQSLPTISYLTLLVSIINIVSSS